MTPWTAEQRLSCPSLSSGPCSNSCPLRWWCYLTILSSVTPFSSCPQSFPASRSFLISRLFASGGQSTRDSASASVLPMNIQGWFPLGLTDFISLLSKGLPKVSSSSIIWKHQFFGAQPSLWSQLSCLYMTTGKTIALTIWTFIREIIGRTEWWSSTL